MLEDLTSSSLLVPVAIAAVSATVGFFARGDNRRETQFLKKENYRLKHMLDLMLDKSATKISR